MTSTLAALQAQTFTYDADDRISGDTFDANGNTITSGGVTYTYDFEDRLLSTSNGVTIVYDGDGMVWTPMAQGSGLNVRAFVPIALLGPVQRTVQRRQFEVVVLNLIDRHHRHLFLPIRDQCVRPNICCWR